MATLLDPSIGLSAEAVAHLCNPPYGQSSPPLDAGLRLVLDLYLVNLSEATYEANHTAILCYSPHLDLPSYYRTT